MGAKVFLVSVITTPADDKTTIFDKVIDPIVRHMTINDLRIVLDDAFGDCDNDADRINAIIMMLTTMGPSHDEA